MMEPQAVGGAFDATKTLLASVPALGIPEVKLDEPRGLWSVRRPGMEEPAVHRVADIRSCIIEEVEGEQQPAPEGFRGIGEIFLNPMAVSRSNALRRGNRILGVDVVVELEQPLAPVRITLWAQPLKRGTRSYRNVIDAAQSLKRAFDDLMTGEGHG